MYVACADGLLHLLSLEGLVWQQCLRISEKSLRCIAVNPHTGHLAIGSSDCKLHILTAEGKRVSVAEGHANSVFTAAYMPESGKLLSGSRDAKIKLWDPGQGYALQETVAAHTFALNSLSLSHKADTFVTGSMDKTIKVWDKTTLRLLKVIDKARHGAHSASVNKVLYTEYNNLLLSCSDDQRIMAFGLHTEA